MTARVLVVDDSVFMRKIITDILSKDKLIKVVGTARDGKEALEKIKELKPNVVTLDIEMPVKDGIETLKEIVKDSSNISVIMVSNFTPEGAELTLKALDIGAFDFIQKPDNIFRFNNDDYEKKIIEKVKIASKSKTKYRIIENIDYEKHKKFIPCKNNKMTLISIGTSTGGPKALQCIIPKIPKNINGAFLVVQHMPPKFTKSLAERLNSMSEISVVEATDNELIKKGFCYIAPGGLHMIVVNQDGKLMIKLTEDAPVLGFRPSVNVLMNSVSKINCVKKIGVILTGMGSDGAVGMKKIFENNGYTIAQDEESSIVFGMPKSSIKLGGVHKILPLREIAYEIINKVGV